MSAIVNIKSTKNLTKAVNYASGYNGKAKAHNGYNMPRVLCQSGVNCTPKNGLKRMMDRVKRKQFLQTLKPQSHRKIVQGYTLIQSFDKSFDYKNPDDVKKVNELGQKLVGQVVPDKLALVYTQADGTHHMLHNHIIVCSLSENLRAMHGNQTNFRTWAKANDEVLKAEGLETLAPVSSKTTAKEKLTRAEIAEMDKLSKNKDIKGNPAPKRTRMEEIKEKIEEIEQDPSVIDFDSFVEVAKKHDLDVHTRINKKGVLTGLSYKLLNTDMKRGIRARRLGANYMKESLNDVFQSNLERRRLAKQREARIEAGGSSATAETAETRQLSSTNIEFVEQSSDLRKEAQNRVTARTARRTIRQSVNRDIRRGFEKFAEPNSNPTGETKFDFFEFTRRFGNNERKHRKFDEHLRQFVAYRQKLDEIRAEQLKQQQQANTVALLSRVELDRKLAKAAGYKQTDSKRIKKQQKLVTKFGYTLKREYSDYADMLTNQDYADMQYILHPEWFVKPEQQNPETPTQTTQKQQNQNIDDDGWNL